MASIGRLYHRRTLGLGKHAASAVTPERRRHIVPLIDGGAPPPGGLHRGPASPGWGSLMSGGRAVNGTLAPLLLWSSGTLGMKVRRREGRRL